MPVALVDEVAEAEPVAELVQDDRQQVALPGRLVVVEAQVEHEVVEKFALISALVGVVVRAGEVVGEGGVVPGVGQLRAREVPGGVDRSRRSEHARGERRELGVDVDVRPRMERVLPDVGRELEDVEPLLAERDAHVAAHRLRPPWDR